jgi:hypothetical protein
LKEANDMAEDSRYDVVWPLGRTRIEEVAPNERPGDLTGKRIAFIWDNLFKGPEMFDMIRQRLSARYDGVSYVDHSVFGNIHATAAEEKAALSEIPDILREHGVDAVITAVGA